MSSCVWNNRVWKNTDVNGNVSVGIYETYYNDAGEICGKTDAPSYLIGEDTVELKETLQRFQNCLTMPMLNGDGFVFASLDGDEEEDVVVSALYADAESLFKALDEAPLEDVPVKEFKGLEGAFDDPEQGMSVEQPAKKSTKGNK